VTGHPASAPDPVPAESRRSGSQPGRDREPPSASPERVLAERVPWLRLDDVLAAAARTAERVLAAGNDRRARAAVLPELGPALGFDWGVLWWPDPDFRRTAAERDRAVPAPLVDAETWRSPALERRGGAHPSPTEPPNLAGGVTCSTTARGGALWRTGLRARLLVPLRSRSQVVGGLELLGSGHRTGPGASPGCPAAADPASCRCGPPGQRAAAEGTLPGGPLDLLADLLGAALVDAERIRAMREHRDLMAALLEVVPAGTVVVSPSREVLTVNDRLLSMFGIPRSQAMAGGNTAQTLAQIHAAAAGLPEVWQLLDLAHTPGTGEIQRTITQRDGRILEIRGAPVVDRRGVYRGRAWFVRDETARHRAEQAVQVLADTLVASLLPPHLPQVPGAVLASRYQASAPESEIGGDFYDVFSTGAGRWAISFGDVCGSGPEAAVVTALARHTVRAVAVRRDPPSAVLSALNRALLSQQEPAQRFLTALQLDLEHRPDGGFDVTVACGGHPQPFVRRADGRVERLGEPGTLLGVLEDPELTDLQHVLAVGDVLVLVTDGVLEARDEDGEELGDEGLSGVLSETPGDPELLVGAVAELAAQRRVGNLRDDFAVLAFAPV
jgi:serine phosphatase RsbU (regulator of sigma subunit)